MDQYESHNVSDTNNLQPTVPVTLKLPFIKSLIGWATFKAVIDIIGGALACLGIITAAYGIPQIISAIKLLSVVDELKRYQASNDIQKFESVFDNFQKYFKLSGISIIVKLSFYVIFIILYVVFIFYLISNSPDLFRNIPQDNYFIPQDNYIY